MKLYCDPISTTTRPVVLFAMDHGLQLQLEHVDLMTQQQLEPAYLRVNPNGLVPYMIDDDGFELGESSAILKYLADKVGSPAYPAELKARARVNAAMDWFATNLHKDFCGFVCYPQLGVFPDMPPAVVQAIIAHGEVNAPRWLTLLDEQMIGENDFVCGNEITLADYLGSAFVTLGELVAYDFSPNPNVRRWLAKMKAQPGWNLAYAAFNGWLSATRSQSHVTA
jgi:glutathione S-transferase